MSIILISLVIASFLIALIVATIILLQDRHSSVYRWLATFLVSAGLWGLIINLQNPAYSAVVNVWVIRATFIAALIMAYSMFRFVQAASQRSVSTLTQYSAAIATVIGVVCVISHLVIPSVVVRAGSIVPHRSPLYVVIVAYILLLCITALGLVLSARRKARTSSSKRQLSTLFLGLASGVVLGGLTNIVLPNILGSVAPARYAWIAIVVWTGSLMYTVVRHRFLDIRLAAVRTVTYVLSLVTLAAGYYVCVYVIMQALVDNAKLLEPITIIIALALGFIFQPTKRFFDRLTHHLFYRDTYSSRVFFAEISKMLTLTTDLRSLLERAATYIATTFKAEQSFFFVRYGEDARYVSAGTKQHAKLPTVDLETLYTFSTTNKGKVIMTELVSEEPIKRLLTSHHIAVALPLMRANVPVGYLFLGDKRTGGYTRRDSKTLESVSNELVIAIQNAVSVHEVRELNATLQQRIDSATKELRASNEQLRRLDEAKDEFVSMASHQLRTPLTSVKGYISMLLEGDAGEINETQKHFLGEAFTSSERMVHLINDFLNVSRLQTGKFVIDRRLVNLKTITEQEVDSLRTTAKQRQLTLKLTAQAGMPTLYVDESKMRQVIMNFIDNALYYSASGTTITITLKAEEGKATLTVEDTGIGVPQSEQAHLFSKFYRASNARKQRPDGTGVGLFLAKKVIVSHGGSMIFSSEEGKGSTFGFALPIEKLKRAPAEDPDSLDH